MKVSLSNAMLAEHGGYNGKVSTRAGRQVTFYGYVGRDSTGWVRFMLQMFIDAELQDSVPVSGRGIEPRNSQVARTTDRNVGYFNPRGVDPLPAAAPLGGRVKRVVDILLVLAALPFLLPLMLGVALLMKLSDPGPLLYGHRRVGFRGQAFSCWKFRTMVVDGDRVLQGYLAAHPDEARVWRAERKLMHDPRVTPLGAVLRKLSIDELPQIINILRGEMSLVGPRPVVRAELDEQYGAAAPVYLSTRPGLTGLWQVSGRSDTSYAQRVRFDCDYVARWSLWRDLKIILLTVPALALSRGAR